MRLQALFLLLAATLPCLAQSYLVAPFTNRTKVAQFEWLGESLAETIRETLAEEGVNAVPRDERADAVRKLALKSISQATLASLAKLSEAAGAERLVYGRLEFVPSLEGAAATASKGTLRVTARVFDVKEVVQVAEFFETGPVEELAALETGLAWKVRRWVRPDRPMDLDEFRRLHPPAKLTARESYIRGLMAPSPEQRHRLLTQAARLDPLFPQPAFALGREHFEKGNFREAAGWLDRVPPRSVDHVESRFLLALCRYQLSEFDLARLEFERIGERLPAPEVWNNLGAAHARLNRGGEALASFEKALAGDAADPDYRFNVGYTLWKRGDFEAAANHFRAVLDRARDDQDAIQLLGRCLKKSGPRAGDWRSEGLERVKESYEEPGLR